MSAIALMKDLKPGSNARPSIERAAIWLFEIQVTISAEEAITFGVAMPNIINTRHERTLRTYSKVVKLRLKRYTSNYNIADLDKEK